MKFWIAREKSGGLRLFKDKPIHNIVWRGECVGDLDYRLFTEVTFENSPQEVEFKLVEK